MIEFTCDRSAGEGEPVFIEKDGLVYLFRFYTSYVCPPHTTECKAVDDHGHMYDLSYLTKSSGNWEVVDTRPNHSDLRYYINVCAPVNPMAGKTDFCAGETLLSKVRPQQLLIIATCDTMSMSKVRP